MGDEINEKYQQHYNQVLVGTLNDTFLKSISFQANIRLANEIIKEQETKLKELHDSLTELREELASEKSKSENAESQKLSTLQNTIKDKDSTIKSHLDTINKLNAEISDLTKIKDEYDTIKGKVQHIETFRSQLVQAREENKSLKDFYENEIERLNTRIETSDSSPAKKKKNEEVKTVEDNLEDGGSF